MLRLTQAPSGSASELDRVSFYLMHTMNIYAFLWLIWNVCWYSLQTSPVIHVARPTNMFFFLILQNGDKSKSRIPNVVASALGFGQKHEATVDIPLDSMNVIFFRSIRLPMSSLSFWIFIVTLLPNISGFKEKGERTCRMGSRSKEKREGKF